MKEKSHFKSELVTRGLPLTTLDPTVGVTKPLGTFPLRGVVKAPALVEVVPTRHQRYKHFPVFGFSGFVWDWSGLEQR